MFESKLNRGRAGGYAPLDGTGKVPLDKLPPIQSTVNTGSFATTSSLQTLINATSSFATVSQLLGEVISINNIIDTLATTGSNEFYGNQLVSGSVYADNLVGLISSSVQITDFGFINSASQLTSSYDTRYTLSGSIQSLPSNLISSSAQISAFGFINSSQIIDTGSFATTGSNTFRGTTTFATVGGDEGGEIEFGVPSTNTSLTTRVVTDIWRDRFRIFDGNTKGVFIDLSKAPVGVAGEITWKTSGYVNAGTFVQLDNIKATVTTGGNRGLSIGAVSTNFTANVAAHFYMSGGGSGGNAAQNVAYTTTAASSAFNWHFGAEADTSTYIINDKTNNRMYRVTLMIGPAYLNNFISIERLH